jgi:GTP-binding protein
VLLVSVREMTLEFALGFIEDDELVEVTPKHIRMRKKHLTEHGWRQANKKRLFA